MLRALINWLSQAGSIVWLSVETAWERKASSLVAIVGIAGVVAVLVGVLSMAQGFRRAMDVSATPDGAIVLRAGADTEMMSVLTGNDVKLVADAPGVARGATGPLASSELFVIINLPKRATGTDANVPLRGAGLAAFDVRDDMRIVDGRKFVPGRNEIVVGVGAVREFSGLELGATLRVGPNVWTIVGIFSAAGGMAESEIWADAQVLQSVYGRGNSYQSVSVRLTSPDAFVVFRDALTGDPRLNVKVMRQADYFAEQATAVCRLITGIGTMVALLMALGAVFGALNTMYTAVAARTREIATLRALGFGAGPVVLSVLVESLVLALLGGLAGAAIAYMVFDGYRAATINWQSFSQVAFAFAVSPSLLAQGIAYAAGIGLLGGLFPALRAARLPIATALRES